MQSFDLEHLKNKLQIYERRKQILELQKAIYGSLVPPQVEIDLQDTHEEITQLEEAIEKGVMPEPGDDLAFQNQQDAINFIKNQPQVGNIIINAPAGYGKTYLLKQISLIFLEKNWYVHTVSFNSNSKDGISQKETISLILKSVKLRNENNPFIAGRYFADRLREISNEYQPKGCVGACFIIDNAEAMYNNISGDRVYRDLREFFQGIIDARSEFEDFSIKIIVSGRYIVNERTLIFTGKPASIDLKVFDLPIVQEAVNSFFSQRRMSRRSDWNTKIAAHILYITGGHPLMIRDILIKEGKLIRTIRAGEWLKKYHHHLFTSIIDPIIEEIKADFPDMNLWDDLLQLCVFREFDKSIIRDLFPEAKDRPTQYVDRLERYGLVTSHRSVYRDGVLRPAMLRWLQFGEGVQKYSQKAKEILCKQLHFSGPLFDRSPHVLAEILYICLLETHNVAMEQDLKKLEQRQKDIEQEMLSYMQPALNIPKDELEEFIQSLEGTLHGDTELDFLFNYFFRDQYEGKLPDYSAQIDSFISYCKDNNQANAL